MVLFHINPYLHQVSSVFKPMRTPPASDTMATRDAEQPFNGLHGHCIITKNTTTTMTQPRTKNYNQNNNKKNKKTTTTTTTATTTTTTNNNNKMFCCTLLACHEGRGRSPSVSEVGEKTDLPTFHDITKPNTKIKQQCKQTN